MGSPFGRFPYPAQESTALFPSDQRSIDLTDSRHTTGGLRAGGGVVVAADDDDRSEVGTDRSHLDHAESPRIVDLAYQVRNHFPDVEIDVNDRK